MYGIDAMGETAENVAAEWKIARADQDAFAYRSQQRAAAGRARLAEEIVPVSIAQRKETITVDADEHPRADTTLEALAQVEAGDQGGRYRNRRQRVRASTTAHAR